MGRRARRVEIRGAVEPAQFDSPEDQGAGGVGVIGGAHQRASDEEAVDLAREPVDIGASSNAGFRDEDAVGRQRRQPLGRRKIDRQIAKVAVVDPDQRRAERERAAHLGFVMDLDQRIHAEAPRLVDHGARLRVVEQREHDEDGIGAGDPRLGHLARIEEEILGEDRSVDIRAARRRGRRAIRRRSARR